MKDKYVLKCEMCKISISDILINLTAVEMKNYSKINILVCA